MDAVPESVSAAAHLASNLNSPGRGKPKAARGEAMFSKESLAFPADTAVARILQDDAALGELLADAVGGREVAALARGLAFGDERFDFRVAGAWSASGPCPAREVFPRRHP